eukprot:10407820-Karenia_brevis.AAC.1
MRVAHEGHLASLAKPAYQDDNYLVGGLTEIATGWPDLKSSLTANGHELNMSKSEVWLPGCDELET